MSGAGPNIVDAIRKGLFTPFLGAGASSLREEFTDLSSHPWDLVIRTLVSMAAHFDSSPDLKDAPQDLKFLRSFASQRLSPVKGQLDTHLPPVPEPSKIFARDPLFDGNALLTLQVELVRSTVEMTNYFAARLSAEALSIHQITNFFVPLEATTEEARAVVEQLFKVASLAEGLLICSSGQRNSPFLRRYPGIQRGLDAKHLYHSILTLVVTLLGSEGRQVYASELTKHRIGRVLPVQWEIREGTSPDLGRLRLDAVQWMSDLLWYTLRYWLPFYPGTAELAFELSLLANDARPRTADLAQAAQVIENFDPEFLVSELNCLLMYCQRYQEDMPSSARSTKAFYYAMAIAIQHQYDLFVASRMNAAGPHEQFRRYSSRDADVDLCENEASLVPIVFTTNFDNAMENVLSENDLTFHVIYPMLSGIELDDEKRPPAWWFKTVYPKASWFRSHIVTWNSITDRSGRPDMKRIEGPLIVKLHGAPCTEKPEDKSRYWLVLSEMGYLQALGGQGSMPSWLNEELGTGRASRRSLWFLGHSIADWNVRLSILGQHSGRRSTVDREEDPYRREFLKAMRVQHWVEDLTRVPDAIILMFRDNRFDLSESVMRLTQRLETLLREMG